MFFQIARENILLLINNIHEKIIKNRMFRRHMHAYPIPCLLGFFLSLYSPCIYWLLNSHTIFSDSKVRIKISIRVRVMIKIRTKVRTRFRFRVKIRVKLRVSITVLDYCI